MESRLPQYHSSEESPRLELLHGWDFLPDPEARLKLEQLADVPGWRKAQVALSWTAQFDDLRDYMGVAWYRIRFNVPQLYERGHVLLKFGAVDYFAEVFVNGHRIGSHEGGYTPFSFDITGVSQPGGNELVVRVIDPPMDEAQNRALCPEMMYNEIPHGKQNWYLQNAGIWQGVRVEFVPAIYVDQIQVTPDISGDFSVAVQLGGNGLEDRILADSTSVHFVVNDTSGRTVCEGSFAPVSGAHQAFTGRVRNPRLWGPDDPALYSVEVSLNGAVQHRKRARFGFRKFEARDGRLYLNGRPFYMIGTLDQDFYPETIHTPASEEFVREMILKAKKLGVNVLRCHLKVAHPVYLTVADEVGMLVWTEMPSWSDCWYPSDHFSTRAADRARAMFEEVLQRDWNHPSVVIQTIMNESWGIDLKVPEQRQWLKDTFNRMKQQVSPLGRLVVDNSACERNFHIKTDIEDFHNYYSMPDDANAWEKWTRELASRPEWTFSPFGDAERTRQEPIIVSEFGNWGLPALPDELPWWFDRSFGGREVTTPAGVLERFREYKLDELFITFNDFAEETQWHQYISLKHEIEDIRRHPEIQGYVVTGMTDVHWEVNGLLDMWRNPKIFGAELEKLQRPDVVMLDLRRYNFLAGQKLEAPIIISHYGVQELRGARVRWVADSGAAGQFVIQDSVAPGTVASLPPVDLTLPEVEQARIERLHIEVRSARGTLIAENACDLFVFPQPRPAAGTPLSLHDPERTAAGLRESLAAAGYELRDGRLHRDTLLVATALDETVERHLEDGGRVLLLVYSEKALPEGSPYTAVSRVGTDLDGRWFSNYNWIRADSPVFESLALGRIMGFESAEVVPRHVIRGVPPAVFDDVLCGVTYGWVAKNSALMLQARYAKGRLLATSFDFSKYGQDPYATHLLDSALRYAGGDGFAPAGEWRPTMRESELTVSRLPLRARSSRSSAWSALDSAKPFILAVFPRNRF